MKAHKSLMIPLIASAFLFNIVKAQTQKTIGGTITPITNCILLFDHDNFTNPSAWTIVDGIDGNGSVVVGGGKLRFSNADPHPCALQHGVANNRQVRTYRPLNNFLNNHSWRAECKVRITDGNGPTQTLMAFTGGTQDPEGTNIPSTNAWSCGGGNTNAAYVPSAQDGIFASLIAFGTDQIPHSDGGQTYPGSYSASATPGSAANLGWRIFGHAKSAAHAANFYPSISQVYQAELSTPLPPLNWSRGILLPALNKDYYIRLERLNSNTCRISVFSDSLYSVNVPGSPQCFSINPAISNLDIFQTASSPSGSEYRSTSGYIANLQVFNGCPYGIPNLTLTSGPVTPCCTDTLHASPGFTNYTWYPGGINTGNQNWIVINVGSTATIDSVTADLAGYTGCPFIATDTVKPCKPKYQTPDPSFSLAGNLPATGNFFSVTATPTMANTTVTGYGFTYSWEVDMENPAGTPVYCTVINPSNWHSTLPTITFPGYSSTATNTCSNSGATTGNGNFYVGYRYKITRTIKSPCGTYTSSKSIMLCQGCKGANGGAVFTIVGEQDGPIGPDTPEFVADMSGTEHAVKVYPNPSKGLFNIQLGNSAAGTIEVYDMMGRSVKTIELNSADTEYKLDLTNFPKGLYMLNMIIDGNRSTQKLIVE
jgi:hypothetical protein